MLVKVYTVYDQAAEAYLDPFFAPTRGVAIRLFTDAVNNPNQNFNRHPEDFTLYEIGTFDSSSGIVAGDRHESCGNAVEFLSRHDSPNLEAI